MSGKSSKRKQNKQAGLLSKKGAGKNKKTKGTAVSMQSGERPQVIALVIMLVVIALLVFIGPFQRGLFFPRELLQTQIVVFGLLIVWGLFRVFKKDSRLIETPLDICLIVLLAAYFVSFFVAVHKRDALEELFKIGLYLVVYLVTLDICRHWRFPLRKAHVEKESSEDGSGVPPGLNIVLHLLLIAATVITIASFGVPAGHWDFVGAYAGNRIASPIGYANTAAAYFMAAYLLSLGLAPLAGRWNKVFYLAPAVLMLMGVVLTFSRGAWLLLPPLGLLLIITVSPGQRLRSFLYLAVTGLAGVPAALLVDPVFRSDVPVQGWIYIAVAVIFVLLLGLLVELYLSQTRKLRISIAVSSLALVSAAVIIGVIIPTLGPVHLERPVQETAQTESYRQVISDIEPGETYQLSLQVKAEEKLHPDGIQPDYAWGIRVLGGLPDFRDEELLNYRGSATDGWENKEFTFRTAEEATRLDIRIYNRYPGTSVTARSVKLSTAVSEQELRFTLSRILPESYFNRIYSYSRDRNLDRRFELFEDAVKVIQDYPVLGAGGGAWEAVYRAYQDQVYHSTEVHNHYLQVWIEAGIFGFLAFLGMWVSFAAAFIRNCIKGRASPVKWQYWSATFLPVAALGVHSAIDWNFSMAAVGIFLFILLGAGRSLDQVQWFKRLSDGGNKPVKGTIIGVVALIVGLFLTIYSTVLLYGLDATWGSQRLMERGNISRAMTEMDRAIRLDPFRAENYHNLSVLIEDRGERMQVPADPEVIFYLAERAYEMEPYNPSYFVRYGDLLISHVDVDQGLSQIDRMMEMRPHSENSYVRPANSRLQLVQYFVDTGNRAIAEKYGREIIELEQKMENELGDSSPLAYIIGRKHHLLGRHTEAERYYEAVEVDDQFYEDARQKLVEIRGEEELDKEGEESEE